MYIVRFIKKSDSLVEDYYYARMEDAMYHIKLFEDDNSGLYKEICLLELDE